MENEEILSSVSETEISSMEDDSVLETLSAQPTQEDFYNFNNNFCVFCCFFAITIGIVVGVVVGNLLNGIFRD